MCNKGFKMCVSWVYWLARLTFSFTERQGKPEGCIIYLPVSTTSTPSQFSDNTHTTHTDLPHHEPTHPRIHTPTHSIHTLSLPPFTLTRSHLCMKAALTDGPSRQSHQEKQSEIVKSCRSVLRNLYPTFLNSSNTVRPLQQAPKKCNFFFTLKHVYIYIFLLIRPNQHKVLTNFRITNMIPPITASPASINQGLE